MQASRTQTADGHRVKHAPSLHAMDASIINKNSHRRSSAGQSAPPARSRGPIYHTEAAPRTRSVSSQPRSSSQSSHPQHRSLSRVKGRRNMYTPPRMSPERSWLKDQSPVHGGTRTPPRQCTTSANGTPTLVNPSSSLLHDLLKEQRAHRGSRGPVPEDWNDNGRSTPDGARVQEDNASTASEKARKANDVFSTGLRKPKEMGMREMDQYVSKINKLNFDLKLEIFHRTQQMATLEKKLERMKEMEEKLQRMQKLQEEVEYLRSADEDNRKLRESNEQLRQELDKRDQAVTEAVQLICQLEGKIDELETGGRSSQTSMSRLTLDGPNATTPKVRQAVEIPERTSSREKTSRSQPSQPKSPESRQLAKAPSFLRADNQSTATLRSLYAPENSKSHTTLGELTKSGSMNTMDETEPESPRLSVLSEASELNPFDTPSGWNEFDELDIPVRKTSSASSLDSYVRPVKPEDSKSEQVDEWLQSHDTSRTIVRRRQNRALSHDSETEMPAFNSELFSTKARGCPRIYTSIFGEARLPPTPDTMSTAYAAVHNGSNGSIAPSKSPKTTHDQWFASRRLDRHHSADEITTRRSLDGSDITDSMQTNCSDTPRLGVRSTESPTIFPFNTVAPKASRLLGPGSPNNPAINSFSDLCQGSVDEGASPTANPYQTPTKATASGTGSTKPNSSSPLTPQDWVAAAANTSRSQKEQDAGLRIEQQEEGPNRNITSQGPFHDNESMDSISTEPDGPGIPTLDMHTLDLLEQPAIEPLAIIRELGQHGPESESRRRFSLRPSFLTRSNGPRHLQFSPMAPDYFDSEDDGAPPPIIRKHRCTDNARPRPMSQIITDSADIHKPNPPTHDTTERNLAPKTMVQPFTEAKEASLPTQTHSGSATISSRPSTSHSMDNKRRSSLGIFSWMRNVNEKRSEPVTPVVAETFANATPRNEQRSRLVKERPEMGYEVPCPTTPESMGPSRAEMLMSISMHPPDETTRRPRYMGRRSRRG